MTVATPVLTAVSTVTHLKKILLPTVLLVVAATLMVGCNRSIKPEVHEPVKLVSLAQPLSILAPVLSLNAGHSNPKDPLDLRIGYDRSQIITASRAGMLSAYDSSGRQLWSVDVGDQITGGVAYDSLTHMAIISTRSGQVQAFDSLTGNKRWQQQLTGTVLTPALISQNRVVLSANDGFLHGLSLQTGQPVWKFATQVPAISIRGVAAPTLLDSETALLATADGRMHAITLNNGIPLWSRRVGLSTGGSEIERMSDVDGTPVVDNDQLYAISYSGQLLAVKLSNKQVLFVNDVASLRAVTVTPTQVIATSLDGQVIAYDRNTGEQLWENNELLYRQLTNPVTIGKYIAIGDYQGVVHLFDPQTGKIVSRVDTKGALTSLQVVDSRLMTQSSSGHVAIWQLIR